MKIIPTLKFVADLAAVVALCVASAGGIFVARPLLSAACAGIVAAIALSIRRHGRRIAFLFIAGTLVAASLWEVIAVSARWDIRVDLLVLYPALWLTWVAAIMVAHNNDEISGAS